MEFQYGSETCLYSLLLIARQTAQLVCLGCKINNSEVHVTINKCTYATITSCEQKVTVCMCYIKTLDARHLHCTALRLYAVQ